MSVHRVKNDINLADDKVVNFKKLGIQTDKLAESTTGSGVTVENSTLKVDTINEETSTAGVIIEGVQHKDSIVYRAKREYIETAASKTVVTTESNSFILVTQPDKIMTLPSTEEGLTYTFAVQADALSAGVGLRISPAAADAIMGNGLTSVDDKDLMNSGATDAEGDSVTLVGDGIDGWYITAITGTWVKEG